MTNETGHPRLNTDPTGICSFDVSEIPGDTAQLLECESVQRESPLTAAGIAQELAQSKSLTIKIPGIIAKASKRGLCTVYRRQVISIDNKAVTSPPLYLKLFDDQFIPTQPPDDGTTNAQDTENDLR